jgi:thiamine transport system permease protein
MAPWLWPGLLTATLLLMLFMTLLSVLGRYSTGVDWRQGWGDPYWRGVVSFTLKQALLSTLLSLFPAIPVALALARRRFWGRRGLLQLLSLSPVLPAVVVIFGLITVTGRQGWLAQLSAWMGLSYSTSLYGLHGLVLVHVFFNLPLATRWLLQTLSALPQAHYRLAQQLRMSAHQRFRWLEWPRLRWQLCSVAGLIFSLCCNSFTTGLILGGGPQTTPLAVAIYQSFNEEGSLGQAIPWVLLQISCCLGVYAVGQHLAATHTAIMTIDPAPYWDQDPQDNGYRRCWDGVWILSLVLLLLLPLLAVVVQGCNRMLFRALAQPLLWRALGCSLAIGGSAALLAVTLACLLLWSSSRLQQRHSLCGSRGLLLSGTLISLLPPVVLATSLLQLFHAIDIPGVMWGLISVINGLIALPYALKILTAPLYDVVRQTEHLCQGLGIQGFNRWRLIDGPLVCRPLALALALTTVLSLGEVGIMTLFGQEAGTTLALHLYQQLGAYRGDEAAVTALLLLLCCWGLLRVSDVLSHCHVTVR